MKIVKEAKTSVRVVLGVFLPPSFDRKITLKNPESEPSLRMNGVVYEFSKFDLLLTNVRIEGRTVRVLMHSVPEAKVRSSCSVIVSDDVVRVGDPVSGWRQTFFVIKISIHFFSLFVPDLSRKFRLCCFRFNVFSNRAGYHHLSMKLSNISLYIEVFVTSKAFFP